MTIKALLAASLCFVASQLASASVILSPTAVVGNTMGTAGGSTSLLIDQSGLSSGFISGTTDFASYLAGSPTHAPNGPANGWAGVGGPALGHLDFDLGSVLALSDFVLWTQQNANAVDSFTLFSALDAGFTSGVQNLGTFSALIGGQAQSYAISGVGEFVRLQVNSIHGGANVNIGEVAFGVDQVGVPEPLSVALVTLGLLGVGVTKRRRC